MQHAPEFKPGNGLRNMDRRMQQLNGTFIILTEPGNGTELKFSFPL